MIPKSEKEVLLVDYHCLSSKIPRLLNDPIRSVTNGLFETSSDTALIDATFVDTGLPVRIACSNAKVIGSGSFGIVFTATLADGREVAIKKVLQDKRYKNQNESFLNLVQEFVPQTLSRLIRHYLRQRQTIPLVYVKVYSFQLLRGLAYIHNQGVCHRDIKPQNLLINPENGILKICDFGSAKILHHDEPNVSYICSRYYRAPELIFGATYYTIQIDMWSAGCVIGELLLGRPLFPGNSGVDQLVEIIKVLGTPSHEQIQEMNPHYSDFQFPAIRSCSWDKIIRNRTANSAFTLLQNLLVYSPTRRMTASQILGCSFFSDLISPPPGHPPDATGHLPNGRPTPNFVTDFTENELAYLPDEMSNRLRVHKTAIIEKLNNSTNRHRESVTDEINVWSSSIDFNNHNNKKNNLKTNQSFDQNQSPVNCTNILPMVRSGTHNSNKFNSIHLRSNKSMATSSINETSFCATTSRRRSQISATATVHTATATKNDLHNQAELLPVSESCGMKYNTSYDLVSANLSCIPTTTTTTTKHSE